MEAQEKNYVKGTEKRQVEHFEWFVRYQVQGWSKEKQLENIMLQGKMLVMQLMKLLIQQVQNQDRQAKGKTEKGVNFVKHIEFTGKLYMN